MRESLTASTHRSPYLLSYSCDLGRVTSQDIDLILIRQGTHMFASKVPQFGRPTVSSYVVRGNSK
jgi:hypothetical protein